MLTLKETELELTECRELLWTVVEIKLILLIVAMCALATLGITAAYADMTGTMGRVAPLLIVIGLIATTIFLLEISTQKAEIQSRGFESAQRENTIGTRVPLAATAGFADHPAEGQSQLSEGKPQPPSQTCSR